MEINTSLLPFYFIHKKIRSEHKPATEGLRLKPHRKKEGASQEQGDVGEERNESLSPSSSR